MIERNDFEAAMWDYYLGLKAKGWSAPGEGDQTPEALFWREESGKYGVLSVEAAWNGWQMARKSVVPAPVAKPRLIGWRTSDFLMETADKAMAQNWEVQHEMLPIFEGDSYTSLQAAPVAQLSEPPASAALMRILKIVQDYVPPDGTPIEEAMSQIIACVDPWPDTGFNQFDDLLDDAAEWSGYVEVDTAPYGLKRHLKEVFEKYGITAAAPTTPKD